MKCSENANYLEYMGHFARADYAAARAALRRCILDVRGGPPAPLIEADLLQHLGALFYLEGNISEALRHYQRSEQIDPDALLPRYYFAKFLGEQLRDLPWALAKCDEIIQRATVSPIEGAEVNYGTEEYVARALELKSELLSMER